MSKGSQDATVSTYYVGMHLVTGHGPWDSVNKVVIDNRLAWEGTSTGGTITINQPELFGGVIREGGIVGDVDIAMGLPSQSVNSYLYGLLGDIPAFRGVVSIILKQVLIGNNYYMKPWAIEGTRIHLRGRGITQWQDSLAEPISGLINAAHVLRECLTDGVWGLGHSSGLIHEASFLASAQTLYDEELGFAWFWNNESSVKEFIDSVLTHVQGSIYQDRQDGLFHFDLARKIADPSSLLLLDETNVSSVSDFRIKSIGELTSTVIVKYENNATGEQDTASAPDAALAQRQLIPIVKTTEYSGVATPEVALKLAIRDQQQLSVPIYTCTIVCNREAENLNIGSAFRLNWPDYVEDTLVMRVLSLDLGTATKQQISIEAIQDVYHAADIVYTTPPSSAWENPIHDPIAATLRLINEAPYYIVATTEGDTFAQAVDTTETFMIMAAVSPTQDSISAGLWSTTGATYVKQGSLDFCFTATLATSVDKDDTSFVLSAIEDLTLLTVDHFIQIDNELVAVTVVGSTLTVVRGVLDTVPATHSSGARLWGWHDFSDSDKVTYLVSESVNVKLTPITPKGELAIGSAPSDNKTLTGRMHLPYPPGNVKINTLYWPASVATGTIALTWATRNRLQQTASLIGWYTTSITSEASVTYSATLIRTDTSAVLDSFTGETGTSRSLTTAYVGQVELEIWSVNPNGDSMQTVSHIFNLT